MTTNKMRDDFEAWVMQEAQRREYGHMSMVLKRDNECYATTWVDCAWLGWQASRESLRSELLALRPASIREDDEEYDHGHFNGGDAMLTDCLEIANPSDPKVKS